MSVLACDRKGCENIMCDRCSRRYGYICNNCFQELVKLGPDANIAIFMGQEKNPSDPDVEDAAMARFQAIFPLRWDEDA